MKKLSLLFSLLLVFSLGCGEKTRVEVPDTARQDAKLMPAETNALMYCDFSQIAKSPQADRILAQIEQRLQNEVEHEEYQNFKEATGFDPRKDFHSMLAGALEGKDEDRNWYAVIHGRFDEQRLTSYLKEQVEKKGREIPWQEEIVAGHRVYASNKRPHFGLCFLNESTIYLGNREWIAEVLETKTSGEIPKIFTSAENTVRYGDQFWVKAEVAALHEKQEPFSHDLHRAFPKFDAVEDVVFSAHVSEGMQFEGQILCDNAQDSKLLVDMLKGALAAAKLQVSNDRTAVDALNGVKINHQGNKALVQGELTEKFFETLRTRKLFIWREHGHEVI